jgi:hypothetical protein
MSHISQHGPRGIPDGLTIEEYTVGSWCRSPDGSGKPEAVALCLSVKGLAGPLVMRLKTRRAVDDMIRALKTHRDDVFGNLDN